MRVFVACEFSGIVRRAFRERGHDAWSCDLLPAEDKSEFHIKGDCLAYLRDGWDMMIAFPPCTHLSSSGARWWPLKRDKQAAAIEFVKALWTAPISRIAIENPVGILSRHLGNPTQIIHPWQFGHGEVKTTCLWLWWLMPLQPTQIVAGREQRIWRMPPSANRGRERSRTYPGIAQAMAEQWG